jgi:hypothetical protein
MTMQQQLETNTTVDMPTIAAAGPVDSAAIEPDQQFGSDDRVVANSTIVAVVIIASTK